MSERVTIPLSLLPESIELLVTKGEFAHRLWLDIESDGTYTLHAIVPDGDVMSEAIARIGVGQIEDPGPLVPEPSDEVAEAVTRIKERLGW